MEISDEAYLKAAVELFLGNIKSMSAPEHKTLEGCARAVSTIAKELKKSIASE